MSLLIRRARILTLAPPHGEAGPGRRGKALRELGVLARGDVLVEDGKIAAVAAEIAPPAGAEVIDADGRVLMPGFVDCHTHACWAGDPLPDWEQQLGGVRPAELARRGGGVHTIVRGVREATRKQLAASLRTRLDVMLRAGTTTVEVKSGYGLTIEAELKMLYAIQRVQQEWPGTVVPTALLGQAIEGDEAAHTRMVVREMLPAVWHEFPGITIDACCDSDAWPLEACQRLYERAHKHGLPLRVETDRLGATGMVPEALKFFARSVDGLESASKADMVALAASNTFAVIMPGAAFHLDGRYARAGAFVDAGGLLALASNCNPLTAPSPSMPLAIALAVRYCGLSPAEAIMASTVNAAAVLGMTDRGTIEPGKRADLVILRHRDERMLAFEAGAEHVDEVIVAGNRVQ